jgi:hypothetical protein
MKGERNMLPRLLENMTPQERGEVETFAAFVIARRKLQGYRVLSDEIPTQELMKLVMEAGSFNWLDAEEENVYSIRDGEEVQWPTPS